MIEELIWLFEEVSGINDSSIIGVVDCVVKLGRVFGVKYEDWIDIFEWCLKSNFINLVLNLGIFIL